MRSIQVSEDQQRYLLGADYLPPYLIERLAESASVDSGRRLLLEDEIAERFRSAFTERLAQSGFDGDYGLTAEGRMLEGLIDLFNE